MISDWLKTTLSNILQWLTEIPAICIYVGITFVATYFICTDKFYILDQMEHHLPQKWMKQFLKHLRKLISSLGNYLKAEFILVAISFIITLIRIIHYEFYWTEC